MPLKNKHRKSNNEGKDITENLKIIPIESGLYDDRHRIIHPDKEQHFQDWRTTLNFCWENEAFTDAKLRFHRGNMNGWDTLRVNLSVLVSASPILKQIISNANCVGEQYIVFDGFTHCEVNALVEFAYTGDITCLSQSVGSFQELAGIFGLNVSVDPVTSIAKQELEPSLDHSVRKSIKQHTDLTLLSPISIPTKLKKLNGSVISCKTPKADSRKPLKRRRSGKHGTPRKLLEDDHKLWSKDGDDLWLPPPKKKKRSVLDDGAKTMSINSADQLESSDSNDDVSRVACEEVDQASSAEGDDLWSPPLTKAFEKTPKSKTPGKKSRLSGEDDIGTNKTSEKKKLTSSCRKMILLSPAVQSSSSMLQDSDDELGVKKIDSSLVTTPPKKTKQKESKSARNMSRSSSRDQTVSQTPLSVEYSEGKQPATSEYEELELSKLSHSSKKEKKVKKKTGCELNQDASAVQPDGVAEDHIKRDISSDGRTCGICWKECATSQALKSHMKTHNDKKLFRCKICGKEFSLKQHVRRHMLSHISQDYDRENSYLCSTCGRSFTKLSDIALHMGTHIDDVLAKDQGDDEPKTKQSACVQHLPHALRLLEVPI